MFREKVREIRAGFLRLPNVSYKGKGLESCPRADMLTDE
jgi:hypothetical protein